MMEHADAEPFELLEVSVEEKETLRHLLELYQYDTSPYASEGRGDVLPNGLYGYKYLDHYWTEEGRHAFFIRWSGKLAGFALVCRIGTLPDGTPRFSMAEFFVMRRYSGQGIGTRTAHELFDRFRGQWVVSWEETNLPAIRFWERTIGMYTKQGFEPIISAYNGNPAAEFRT